MFMAGMPTLSRILDASVSTNWKLAPKPTSAWWLALRIHQQLLEGDGARIAEDRDRLGALLFDLGDDGVQPSDVAGEVGRPP